MALIASERETRFVRPRLADVSARLHSWLGGDSERTLARRLAGTAFLIRVASAVLAYASQVLFARWMGSTEFGIYVYVWTWVILIGGIVDFGFASSVQRFIPEYTERKQFALLRGFLTAARRLSLLAATAIACIGALLIYVLQYRLDRRIALPLALACIAMPIYGVLHMQEAIARSYNWVNLANLPPFVIRQIVLIALIGGAFMLGYPTDAATATALGVGSYFVITAGQFLVLKRKLVDQVSPGRKSYDFGNWFAVSIPIVLVEAFYLLLSYSDVLVLQQYAPPHQVAVYYAASKTLALVAFVHYAVAQIAAHKFAELHVSGDREHLAEFVHHIVRLTFWPSLAAAALVVAFGVPLLWLFGRAFTDGYHLMFILAVGLLARASVGPAERLLIMLGQHTACAAIYAAAFAINLAVCILLIPHLGPAGAAIGLSSALIVESGLLFAVTKRRLDLNVFVFARLPQPRGAR